MKMSLSAPRILSFIDDPPPFPPLGGEADGDGDGDGDREGKGVCFVVGVGVWVSVSVSVDEVVEVEG
jgi:hypothetical protein